VLWKLDLSFSYGAIGAALSSKQDYRGALDHYDTAVALREEAVAADPEEDFARVALARGYDRQAGLRGRLGDVAGALETQLRRIAIYERRLEEHPERDNVWREYAQAAFGAAASSLDLLEKAPSRVVRRQGARHVRHILDDLVRTRDRWAAENRNGALAPSDEDLRQAIGRCRKLVV
jgi:tetratricopeptide (TPR) repeat protein